MPTFPVKFVENKFVVFAKICVMAYFKAVKLKRVVTTLTYMYYYYFLIKKPFYLKYKCEHGIFKNISKHKTDILIKNFEYCTKNSSCFSVPPRSCDL